MKRGFAWLKALLVSASVVIVAAILFPVFARQRTSGKRPSCQSNLKQISLAMMQYTQDYDDRFPAPGLTPQRGWIQAIMPYARTHRLFYCPSAHTEPNDDPAQLNYTDYWLNWHLGRKNFNELEWLNSTILSGDGNDGTDMTDARYSLPSLPSQWLTDKSSPAYRHLDTLNVLFADGHVKAVRAANTADSPDKGPSFVPK